MDANFYDCICTWVNWRFCTFLHDVEISELEVSFADFPPNRVPAVLSPFLYSEIEDIPLSKLTDFTNMPHSLVS